MHGLQYLFENLNRDDKLLIVDDVFSSGYNVEGVLQRLQQNCRRNMPEEVRVAVPYYKPGQSLSGREPDYFLHTTEDWLVLPYELQGLSIDDIIAHTPSVAHILGSVMKQPDSGFNL